MASYTETDIDGFYHGEPDRNPPNGIERAVDRLIELETEKDIILNDFNFDIKELENVRKKFFRSKS